MVLVIILNDGNSPDNTILLKKYLHHSVLSVVLKSLMNKVIFNTISYQQYLDNNICNNVI